ncbi:MULTISPECIES: DUF6308 family protein [Micromonospora]|uniref:Uncharacterized protein n=1 Tax=Micromonospora sicca TaxID=2202420 RepID=A0A317DAW9_9ACTN|nr:MULTISPECIES: DUF6308 family protein [unclassified Micromonospora]MBM0229060.1 hypothetical protein [Micromonospora sp. ATA51]PWR11230.1 hypothetical protein DKT69_27145 [Micromonospora sp. 4G51]
MTQPVTLAEILAVLDDPRSVPDLQRYFLAVGDAAFAGGQFERLGGGGDRPEIANTVTAEDLIAVQLLSVQVRPHRALDLLQGQLGRELAAELAQIPVDVELGAHEAFPLIVEGGHADNAWRMLRNADGIGWVIAGKLLARKRPKLVPVYDDVVSCAFGTGTGFWEWLHGKLREEGGVLAQRLRALHAEADLPAVVSRLRVLDVVFWMRHRDAHGGGACPGLRLT